MSSRRHGRLLIFALLWFCEAAPAAPFGTNAAARITALIPFSNTVAFAQAKNVPVDKIDFLLDADTVRAGDSVTVLVTIAEKGNRQTQWLLYTTIAGPPGATNKGMTIYDSFGGKFDFPSIQIPVTLRTMGPFRDPALKEKPPKVEDATSSFSLDKGFLSLGLDQAAAAVSRLDNTKRRQGSFQAGTRPFTEEEIKKSIQLNGEWKMTPDEQRGFAGLFPALTAFFAVVQHNESLSDILSQVIDRPSLLSLAVNLGVSSFEFNLLGSYRSALPGSAWGMSNEPLIYEMPKILMLNKHPSLNITMIVTAPRPPLLTSAGILGVLGERPGKSEPYMTIRVISARLAAPDTAAR